MTKDSGKTGVAAMAAIALAVACCAALPLFGALVGSVALGAVFGVAVGVAAAIALVSLIFLRRRRRSASDVEESRP